MFQKLINKLKNPEDQDTSPQNEEDDENPTQIADQQNESPGVLSSIYGAVSPVMDAIIPSAEAGWRDTIQPIQKEQKYLQTKTPNEDEIKQFIINEAKKRGKDPRLVLSHFEKESAFNPSAINREGGGKGARGITQVRQLAFKDAQKYDKSGRLKNLRFEDMSNPKYWKENVIAGLSYYDAINKYWHPKTTKEFLKSYNQGSPSSRGYKSREAENYAKDVMSRYKKHQDYVNNMEAQRELASEGEVLANENKFNKIRKLLP